VKRRFGRPVVVSYAGEENKTDDLKKSALVTSFGGGHEKKLAMTSAGYCTVHPGIRKPRISRPRNRPIDCSS